MENSVAGEPEDVIEPLVLAPRHHFGSAIMTVAPERDVRGRPVSADPAQKPPEQLCDLRTPGRLSGAQHHRHRPTASVVDVDWQEAALAAKAVPERQLLGAVDDINRVIDIEHDCSGRCIVALAVKIDHRCHHLSDLAQARCIFPT